MVQRVWAAAGKLADTRQSLTMEEFVDAAHVVRDSKSHTFPVLMMELGDVLKKSLLDGEGTSERVEPHGLPPSTLMRLKSLDTDATGGGEGSGPAAGGAGQPPVLVRAASAGT